MKKSEFKIENFRLEYGPLKPKCAAKLQYVRSHYALQAATQQNTAEWFNLFLMSAIYFGRSTFEILLSEAISKKIKNEDEIKSEANKKVKHFKLIEYLRIHDFHREAIEFTHDALGILGGQTVAIGPHPNSLAAVATDLLGGGKTEERKKNVKISFDKPIQYRGLEIYIEEEKNWKRIDVVVDEYLNSLYEFLKDYYPKIDEL